MESVLTAIGIIDAMTSKVKTIIFIVLISLFSILMAGGGLGLYLDRLIYDYNVTNSNTFPPPENIIIVALDDNTFDVIADEMDGLFWPYPRSFHATVINNLARAGAKAVFIDIILDIESGFGSEDDDIFMESLSKIPTILASEFNETTILGPLPEFIDAGASTGNVSIPLDVDNRIRFMRNAKGFPQNIKESLHYFTGGLIEKTQPGVNVEDIPTVEQVLHSIITKQDQLPDPGFVHFHGPAGSIKSVSYFEVLNSELFKFHENDFKDKIVFIGRNLSASITPNQQPDVFAVPYEYSMMSGVEIRANAYATLANGRTRYLIPSILFLPVIIIWFIIIIQGLDRLKNPLSGFVFLICSLLLLKFFNQGLYTNNYVLLVSPFIFFSGFYYIFTLGRHYIQERDRRLLTQVQLFNYLPKRVAEYVLKNPLKLAMAGDRTKITLLFADIAGFTTMSEKFSPEIIIPVLQNHLRDMTKVIFENQGTLDKYLGDGIMAFWGAPEDQDNHADLALNTAIEMLEALDLENIKRQGKGIDELYLRIGLHTGHAVVGNIGSDLFIDYTAIGDSVNTASRIEGTGKYFKTRLTISEDCINALTKGVPASLFPLGDVAVKGRSKPIRLYTISDPDSLDTFIEFDEYLNFLGQGKYQKAKQLLTNILEKDKNFGPALFHDSKFSTDGRPLLYDNKDPYWRLEGK